jgi:ABC-2 type transport system ATP-binding protein
VVLQSVGVDGDLTASEAVSLFAGYYPRPRPVSEVIARVGLDECAAQRVATLSAGQRRRLDLAVGIVGRPDVLFLDEPTTGFDPAARRAAWDVVRELRVEGTTVLMTTHYMEEAHALADRVAVLVDGRFVAVGAPDDLGGGGTEIGFLLPDDVEFDVLPLSLRSAMVVSGRRVSLTVNEPDSVLDELLEVTGGRLPGLFVRRPTLEDVYLRLTTEAAVAAG